MEFEGRVALVTAAAGEGIGKACARLLAGQGATVVLTDRHGPRTEAAAQALDDECQGHVFGEPLDVTDEAAVERTFDHVVDRFGAIDVVVNNSGWTDQVAITDMSTESWRRVMDVSLTAHFFVLRAALRRMKDQRRGSVVNLASVAGWMGSLGKEAHYTAAKAGVMGLTRAAASEAGEFGVRVNAVAPGVAWNPFLSKVYPQSFFDEIAEVTPLRRLGTPEDVANAVAFLASDKAGFITGDVLTVSGGWYMHA